MNKKWTSYQAWIAYFDILGFKSLIDNEKRSLPIAVLKSKIEELIDELEKKAAQYDGSVEYLYYADTFIIYSGTEQFRDYADFIRVTKDFYYKSIYIQLPIRGAVSFGEIEFGYEKRILIGKAFLESYEYGEAQNWLGMILTPSASSKLKEHGIDPIGHGFVNYEIPLHKHVKFDEPMYAFCFDSGQTNFECSLIRPLNAMMHHASESEKIKYINTMAFIKKHYRTSKKNNP